MLWKIDANLIYGQKVVTTNRLISSEMIKVRVSVEALSKSEAESQARLQINGFFPAPEGQTGPLISWTRYEII